MTEVQAAYAAGGYDGIGVITRGLEGIGWIDLDNLRDPGTGQPLLPIEKDDLLLSYCEISPSGTGYRIIGKTARTKMPRAHKVNGRGFEIYGSEDSRYLTITGWRFEGSPDALYDITYLIGQLEASAKSDRNRLAANSNVLPFNRETLTVNGMPLDCSAHFYGVVGRMKFSGCTIEQAEEDLRADPERTGAIKYLENGRDDLRKELERAWGKLDDPVPQAAVPIRTRPKFELTLASAWEATDPVWLIDNFVEVGSLVLLFGDPGAGKSFLAIDWAYCVAIGRAFMGWEARQGTVVYVAGEGHRGFGRRREAWGLQHGVDTRGAPVYLSKGPADMLAAVEDVKEAVAALPAPPAMIVFDTLARNFGGGDENSTKDMSAFVAALDHLKADYHSLNFAVTLPLGEAKRASTSDTASLRAFTSFRTSASSHS